MKKMTIGSMILCAVLMLGMLATVSGCANMADGNGGWSWFDTAVDNKEAIGDKAKIADPFTGGWASIVVGGVLGLAGIARTVNREIVSNRRKKVIIEIDEFEESGPALKQVTNPRSIKELNRIFKT